MQLARSLLFLVLMAAATPPFAVGVLGAGLFSYPAAYVVARGWCRVVLWLLERICGLGYRVHGAEHMPTASCVVYLKHQSAWETLAELLIFPRQCWVLKRELLRVPFFGWALAALRPIAIDRGARTAAVKQVIEQGRQRLADGIWVMIFPEGTRMPAGRTRRYGLSGALLAIESGHPILPVAHNAGDFWARRSLLKRRGTIDLIIGAPVDTAGRTPEDVNGEIQAWIEGQMAQISEGYRVAEASAGPQSGSAVRSTPD